VNPYPLRFTNSRVLGASGNRNDHIECRSRDDRAPLVPITRNRQFDQARRKFCNTFVRTVVPPGHELSAQVNGLINMAGSPSHLVGKYSAWWMTLQFRTRFLIIIRTDKQHRLLG
jgi:hypothetical protein